MLVKFSSGGGGGAPYYGALAPRLERHMGTWMICCHVFSCFALKRGLIHFLAFSDLFLSILIIAAIPLAVLSYYCYGVLWYLLV